MTYSEIKLEQEKQELQKQKKLSLKIILLSTIITLAIAVLLFFVRHILIAILGGISMLFLFCFMFYRSNEVHKVLKKEIDFYSDIVYAEKQTEDIIFIRYGDKVLSNQRQFNSIIVKMLKTEKEAVLLYQEDYDVNLKEGRYTVVKAQNILIDYKEAENE